LNRRHGENPQNWERVLNAITAMDELLYQLQENDLEEVQNFEQVYLIVVTVNEIIDFLIPFFSTFFLYICRFFQKGSCFTPPPYSTPSKTSP